MEAILKFNLDNQDDVISHYRCVKSLDMALALFEILRNAKKQCEHIAENQEADSDAYDGVYIAFEKIFEIASEHNIDIDKLIY